MKPSYLALLVLVVLAGALTLVQLWFTFFTADIFFKTMVTLGVLMVVIGIVIAIRDDTEEDGKLKKDKFIN